MRPAARSRRGARSGMTASALLALLALLPLLVTSTSCRRNSAVEPAKVEIEWPDAAPYQVGGGDASGPVAPGDGQPAAAETSGSADDSPAANEKAPGGQSPGAADEKPASGDGDPG